MKEHISYKPYILGFILSLVFTFIPYYLVTNQVFNKDLIIGAILGFALLQLFVQLFFFLHLGSEKNPRWNLQMVIGTFALVLLVVLASIWIMDNLNHNMTPQHMEEFLIEDEGIHVNDTNH